MTDASDQTASTGELVLSLRGVSKHFGAVSALTDIDLDVHAGEVVALVGDNGAGKSTLVKILAGVHQPSAGTITFRGSKVTLSDPSAALHLGHCHGLPGSGALRKPRCRRQYLPWAGT